MPAKPAAKLLTRGSKEVPVKAQQEEKEINRLPDSSSDDDRPSPIRPTEFMKGSSKAKDGIAALSKKQERPAVNSRSLRNNDGRYIGTARASSARGSPSKTDNSPSSSASTTSSKRKSPTATGHGAALTDEFGRVNVKKAKKTFGSSQPRSSQQKTLSQRSNLKKDSFVAPSGIPSSPIPESPPRKAFKKPDLDIGDSTPEARARFQRVSMSPKKEKEEAEPVFKFQKPEVDDIEESYIMSSQSQDPDSTLSQPPDPPKDEAAEPPRATQKLSFKVFNLDDDLLEKVEAVIGDKKDRASSVMMDDEQFLTMTQRACCPMCNAPVDPADIREFGKSMNIRLQEKFCRAHRLKTAKQKWEENDYPTIKWEKLDKRISSHHPLIKKMIKGEASYYREQMEEKIKAGKDRSLHKMTTNLTPGYYGARGLRAISENIMHKFTPLLKKRMVEDELMSARGVTPYVQSVLVPEIASRLIMVDMKVALKQAREILSESTEVGELLNDEVRDVVKKTVVDSEDDFDVDEDED